MIGNDRKEELGNTEKEGPLCMRVYGFTFHYVVDFFSSQICYNGQDLPYIRPLFPFKWSLTHSGSSTTGYLCRS